MNLIKALFFNINNTTCSYDIKNNHSHDQVVL